MLLLWHKAKDMTPSIAFRREAKKEEVLATIFLERTRKGHR